MAEVFIATQDAVVGLDGNLITVQKDVTRVEAGHPLLKQNPSLFKPADQGVHFATRTARSEPRVSKRAAKKAASAKKAATPAAEAAPEPERAPAKAEDKPAESKAD